MIAKNLINKLRTVLVVIPLVVAGIGGAITPAVASATNTGTSGIAAQTQLTPPPTPPSATSNDKVAVTKPQDYAAKGLPGKAGNVSTKTTAGGVHPLTACSSTCYFYGVGSQGPSPAPTGVYTNLKIAQPYLDTADYHTLGEVAVQSADTHQVVEVGWTVDNSGVNGTDHTHPHLFVYHWVNGATTCYNACGFVQYTGTGSTLAGADLSSVSGTAKKFGIEYFSGNWWVAYDTGWVGYFPGTLWSGATPPATFTTAAVYQIFGEVAASTTTPCTDMGNGLMANAANANTTTGAAYVSSTTFTTGSTATPSMSIVTQPSTSMYGVYVPAGTTRSFYYGGPGNGGVTGGC